MNLGVFLIIGLYMPAKKTKDEFIRDAILKHGDVYNYDEVEYINSKIKVKIICDKHGEFYQKPNAHLNGNKCPKCSDRYKPSTSEFISDCIKIHGNDYDYSNVVYKNNKQKITIRCIEHDLEITLFARSHLSGVGCSKCKIKKIIPRFEIVHGDSYDYSKSEYNGFKNTITITCKIHGDFEQNPYYHLDGCGCPLCGNISSIGENRIYNFFLKNNIEVIREHRFSDCKYKNTLPFDFYIPSMNMCIEYDGIQHFEPVEYFGGEKNFKKQMVKDQIKTDYCENNGISLIRISNNDVNYITERLNGLL